MKVGFIGLGNMGQGMAQNLLSKGADLNVYTRNPEKIKNMEKKVKLYFQLAEVI